MISATSGETVRPEAEKHYLAYYKPIGEVSTAHDPEGRPTVMDKFADYPVRLFPVGRLDFDGEGLLLLTNDGELNDRIMRASNYHEKEYVVRTDKFITYDFINAMRRGVTITLDDDRNLTGEKGPDGKPVGKTVTTRPCRVWKTGKREFRIILTQGFNRQIRRMCAVLGYTAMEIKRTRIMNLELGNLKTGMKRFLTKSEIAELKRLAGM